MATRGLVLALGTATALYFMARTTGSGWVMVLFSTLAAIITISAIWSLAVLRSTSLGAAGPADAVAGQRVAIRVRSLSGSQTLVRIRMLTPRSPAEFTPDGGPAPLGALGSVDIDAVATARGVCRNAHFELTCGAPLGLVWWRRRDAIILDWPTFVGPNPSRAPARSLELVESDSNGQRPLAPSDQVRGVREYQPGDAMREVHWPATARTGRPMVKEFEHDEPRTLRLVVDLTGPGGERVAEEIAARAIAALRARDDVEMLTLESTGPVDNVVRSAHDVGRRLACAVTTAAPPASRTR